MLAICAALRWEIQAVLRPLRQVQRRDDLEGVRLWLARSSSGSLLVFGTGVGSDRAAAATRKVVERFSPTAIINTGFAGGLADGLATGDLVIPAVVLSDGPDGTSAHRTDPRWSKRLRSAGRTAGLRTISEPILTSPVPLATATAKRQAHARLGAVAVDMEGEAVARIAAQSGVPFASVRSVLDPAEMDLPLRSGARSRRVTGTGEPVSLRGQATEFNGIFVFANAVLKSRRALAAVFSALLFAPGTRRSNLTKNA